MAPGDPSDDLLARIGAELQAGRARALGPLRVAAERREADEERAVRLAADNLLDKAVRRLAAGDEPAARRFVDRALGMTLEGSEPGAEGAVAVHLFVWDALREEARGSDEDGWLGRAEAVAARLGPVPRVEWLHALDALLDEGELDPGVGRRLGTLTGPVPDREAFEGVAHQERVEATLALLRGLLAVKA